MRKLERVINLKLVIMKLFKKIKQYEANFEGESPDGKIPEPSVAEAPEKQGTQNISFAERVAKTCHEVNRAYCEGHGDFSQVPWEEAPDWQKESVVKGIKFFHENPSARESTMHDNWCAEKLEKGWKYGPEKDPIKKTHPCLVSYSELPFRQKVKDFLFLSVVKSFVTSD